MVAEVAQHRFTVREYHQMGEAGIFTRDDRVELLEGKIYAMSPIGSRHAACVKRLTQLFVKKLVDQAIVSVQDPIELNDRSEPEPDLAILLPRDDFYEEQHPKSADVLLLIEVSEVTLRFDRNVKLPLYAQNGIAEVWIIDLKKASVEVYREPQDGIYAQKLTLKRGQKLIPDNLPFLELTVQELVGK
jgi:Uma2 family endonuclease